MNHTPGPWKFDGYGEFILANDKDGNPFPVAEIRGWGRLSTEYGEKEAVKIQIANGCIIAAAPEMWELLLDLYNDMDVEIPSKYLDRLTDIRTKIEEGGV